MMPGLIDKEFDITDPALDVKQSYFIEASAGTGKTFTIENLYVRLVQEGIPLDQILVVTFTKAATMELKTRIQRNLEAKKIRCCFDEAKIFTIHSFCFNTLKEHALESGFPLDQNDESGRPDIAKKIFKDFLRTELKSDEIHPKQFERILSRCHYDMDRLFKELMHPQVGEGRSFSEIQGAINASIAELQFDKNLLEELLQQAPNFAKMSDRQKKLKSEIVEGLKRFVRLFDGQLDDLFDLPIVNMVPENLLPSKKVSYCDTLQLLNKKLIPLLIEIASTEKILGRLRMRFQQFLSNVRKKEDIFFYDDLISQMAHCVQEETFAAQVRSCYKAALIDEFQDTDRVQWTIFSKLFFGHIPLYLVGDPKQAIYRFRGADLYTYMEAKEMMGQKSSATLTRNFRSASSLICGLNRLFSRSPNLIALPKLQISIPLLPIVAGLPESKEGKIIFCEAHTEEALFSFIVEEIGRLHQTGNVLFSECAILVKDHEQASRFCRQCPLPTVRKKSENLVESAAFSILEDLLAAAYAPARRESVLKVLGGPLFGVPLEQLASAYEEKIALFYRYRDQLLNKGVLFFFKEAALDFVFPETKLYLHMLQLVELINERALSCEESLLFLEALKQEDAESEKIKAWAKQGEDAIQVMTIHVSKGLEFPVVFPVGLISSCEIKDDEEVAEKMRQLYVAMTRAKKRLYFPVSEKANTPSRLFLHQVLAGESLDSFLKSHESFSHVLCEKKTCAFAEPDIKKIERSSTASPKLSFSPFAIHSYTSLQENRGHRVFSQRAEPEIPTGAETGIVLHRLFERLDFTLKEEILSAFIEEQLRSTELEPHALSVQKMVHTALHYPLPCKGGSFCLKDVSPKKMKKEMEFIYPSVEPAGYVKGVIDLFFEHEGRYYIIDWKSNFLDRYDSRHLYDAMQSNGYLLQGSLYIDAVRRYLKLFEADAQFESAFFVFLRGLNEQEGLFKYV